jgi:hypothetical protein
LWTSAYQPESISIIVGQVSHAIFRIELSGGQTEA